MISGRLHYRSWPPWAVARCALFLPGDNQRRGRCVGMPRSHSKPVWRSFSYVGLLGVARPSASERTPTCGKVSSARPRKQDGQELHEHQHQLRSLCATFHCDDNDGGPFPRCDLLDPAVSTRRARISNNDIPAREKNLVVGCASQTGCCAHAAN